MLLGCILVAAVCMKKARKITDASKLAPMTSLTFFSLLKQTRMAQPSGLPLWYGVHLIAVLLRQNERGFRAAARKG